MELKKKGKTMSICKLEEKFKLQQKYRIKKIKDFIKWLKENPDHKIEIDMWGEGKVQFDPIGTPLEEFLRKDDNVIFLGYDEVLQAIGLLLY